MCSDLERHMAITAETLYQAALQLPDEDRLALVAKLLETLPPGLSTLDDPTFVEELERRFADDTGAVPWSQLRAET